MTQNLARVRRCAWVALLLMAALQGWVFRHAVSPDGVAYLDLSDAIVKGRLSDLVNGYWSPLYPVLVGVVRLAVSATPLADPYWEFALLHVVSFLGFALSLAAFEWFLRALDDAGAQWGQGQQPFATPLGRGVAYLFFAVTSLGMISVAGTVPDFFLAAAMFATFACLLRLRYQPADRRSATYLGLAIGLGALAKSFVFPVAVVVLLTLALASWRRNRGAAVIRAAGAFVLVTAPWVLVQSMKAGRLSVGQTGSLNYAWYVNEKQPPNTGVLPALAISREVLPLKGVAVLPAARGTNPLWYEPARWHSDVRASFSLPDQWKRLSHSVQYYMYILAPLLLAIISIGAGANRRDLATTLRRNYVVLIPCLAGLGGYALVYTVSRLIAPFIVASCLALASAFPRNAALRPTPFSTAFGLSLFAIHVWSPPAIRSTVMISYSLALFAIPWAALGDKPPIWRWAISVSAIFALWMFPITSTAEAAAASMGLAILMRLALQRGISNDNAMTGVRLALAIASVVAFAIPSFGFGLTAILRSGTTPTIDAHPEWSAAQRLIREGAPSGSRVAVLGNPENSGWARLARYQIVAVVPDDQVEAFLKLNDADRARVMRVFAQAGATRVVRRPGP